MTDYTPEAQLDELSAAISKSVGLGRIGVQDVVKLGDVEITIQPIGSEDECLAFDYAESFLETPEDPNYEDAIGNKSWRPNIGASFVQRLKQYVVAKSIAAINGVVIISNAEVVDIEGRRMSAWDYIFKTVRSWERHVLDYMFIRYNRMLDQNTDKLGVVLPKQMFMSVIDTMFQSFVEAELRNQEDGAVDSDEEEGNVDPDAVLDAEAERAAMADAEDRVLEPDREDPVIDQ